MKNHVLTTILVLFALTFVSVATGQVLPSPTSYWRGQDNFLDSVGTNHAHLDFRFGYVPGFFDQAFNFNGACVDAPRSASLEPSTVTVQVWAKSSAPGGFTYLIDKVKTDGASAFGGHSYALYTGETPAVYFFCQDANNTTVAFSQSCADKTNIWDGQWHQITGVFDGQNALLYIDGNLQTNGVPTTAAPGTTLDYTGGGDLVIGDYTTNSGGLPFIGSLESVRIFDHALSDTQVMDTFSNPSSPSLTDGLISYYKADGNTLDSAGTNNGTPVRTNIPPFVFGPGSPGTLGDGFVGLGGHATVDDSPSMQPTNLTVQAWVNSAAPGTFKYILSRYPAYCLYAGSDGGIDFFSNGGGNNTPSSGPGTIWDGAWHQITGVFDGASNYLFLDGLEIGQTAATYQAPTPGTPFVFGAATPTDSTIYRGALDEVRLYNTNLTVSQVLQSYISDLGGTLKGWWRAESNAVDVIAGNNGTLTGSAAYTAGKFAGFAFNTGGGVVAVPTSSAIEPAAITIEALVKSANPGANKYILSKSLNASAASYAFSTDPSGGVMFSVTTSSGTFSSPIIPAANIWDNTYHGVAGSYNGSTVMIFLDGQPVGNGTSANGQIQYGSSYNAGQLLLGDFAPTASGANFGGAIDEIRLYSEARTQREIRADVPTGMSVLVPPASQTVQLGSNYTLSVAARGPSGVTGLLYQWQQNGTNILNATNSTLNLSAIQASQLGAYTVLVDAPGVRFNTNVAPPLHGNAFDFAAGMMEIPENGSLDVPYFTYQISVRNQGSPGSYLYVVSKSRNETDGDSIALYTGDSGGLEGYLSIVRTNSGGTMVLSQPHTSVIPPETVWDGNWHQVTMTWDGEYLSLYLDGQLQGQNDQLFSDWALQYDDGTEFQNNELVFAALSSTSTASLHYTGAMDEMKIFNHALSDVEVADTYANPYTSPAATTGLVGYWSGDNQNGFDSAGSSSGILHPLSVRELSATANLTTQAPGVSLGQVSVLGGNFQAAVTGASGQTYIIQVTTNLSSAIWAPIATNVAPFTFTNPVSSGSRFYRAVLQ